MYVKTLVSVGNKGEEDSPEGDAVMDKSSCFGRSHLSSSGSGPTTSNEVILGSGTLMMAPWMRMTSARARREERERIKIYKKKKRRVQRDGRIRGNVG